MTSAFSWQNSISLCPASFCIPRPNLPVTPGVSWLPTGWHYWLDGRESEWTLGVGDGQRGLACCDSWGCKESDTTEWLLECKSRKSRDTWSNRQVWPRSTKWIRAKANRILSRENIDHSKYPLSTTQTTLHMYIQNQIDYILSSRRWKTSIQPAKLRPGADCGSDHELLIAKFRLKLKKVGKTTRPFRYDLNQIP